MPEQTAIINPVSPEAENSQSAPPQTEPTNSSAPPTKITDTGKKTVGVNAQAPLSEADLLSKSEKFLSALGYVSFFFLIPLLMKRDSEFCQYHAKQGLILTIIFIVTGVVRVIPALNVLLGIIEIGVIAYSAFKATQGQKHVLPMVTDMAKSEYLDF